MVSATVHAVRGTYYSCIVCKYYANEYFICGGKYPKYKNAFGLTCTTVIVVYLPLCLLGEMGTQCLRLYLNTLIKHC